MSILKTEYQHYVEKMNKAKEQLKDYKILIKIVSKMQHTKHLTPSEKDKINKIIIEKEL